MAAELWAQWLAHTRKLDAPATLQRAELAGMKIVQPIARQLLGTAGPKPHRGRWTGRPAGAE
ncbi:MAG TPA: hypothetical protein VGA02_02105 [Gemmatimonadales bacterium]